MLITNTLGGAPPGFIGTAYYVRVALIERGTTNWRLLRIGEERLGLFHALLSYRKRLPLRGRRSSLLWALFQLLPVGWAEPYPPP